jgi:hypothetical protein
MKYNPVSFTLSTDKESYYEGEKITFYITITNNDKENSYPVLLPHTQNVGQKLFYLSAYDRAKNTMIMRYTEDQQLKMLVHDTGSVMIKKLKPLEQVVIPIYLNDFDNYYSYHTQTASHHSFGVPLFAGIYKVHVSYHPKGIQLGEQLYNFYNDTDADLPMNGKQAIPATGEISNFITLKIKRSADTLVSIERKKYYIKSDGYRFYYFSAYTRSITTDTTCNHITDLPVDSCSKKNEYFYSHFTDKYAEYVSRFDDDDIREYRKFSDWCPSYLYTVRYNDFKQKVLFQEQLPDKRFYSISYHQPGGNIHQEIYCSADGTLCNETTYVYDKKGLFKRKDITQTQPCMEIQLEGKSRSAKRMVELDGE